MSFLTDLFSGGANTLIDSVGKVLDNVITTKEEKLQLDNEILKADMQYQLDMKKLTNEEQAMVIGDIASARNREIQIASAPNSSWWTKNTQHVLAVGTITLILIFFYILVFMPDSISERSREIVLYILGIMSAILTQIYSYYFGSSAGSAAKDQTIKSLKR
ncbi:MAG: hypothetical protein JZU47_10820 [Prolixibacteraceae bacterium]|nr:hypothetical protein [Prolixibacteraceae bacterium]